MIIPYIISISLLITSVIKVTDAYLDLDKNLKKQREDFISKTRALHKKNSQKGNITILAAALTVMISALFLFFLQKNSIELKEAKFRKESYLCMSYLNGETAKYIKAMTKFNWLFRTLFVSYAAGINTAQVKMAIESAKIARQTRHLYYLKVLSRNKYCSSPEMGASYLRNLPYQTNKIITLKTQMDETLIIGKNQWHTTIIKSPKGIRLKNAFCLQTNFTLQSTFSSELKISTEEIPMPGLSALKCLSGSRSS